MAIQYIGGRLKSTLNNGPVALAEDIAYTTDSNGKITVSLKTGLENVNKSISGDGTTANPGILNRINVLENKTYTVDSILYPEEGNATQTLKLKIENIAPDITKITYSYENLGTDDPLETVASLSLKNYINLIRTTIKGLAQALVTETATTSAATATTKATEAAASATSASSYASSAEQYSSYITNGYFIKVSDGTIMAWKKGGQWVLASNTATVLDPVPTATTTEINGTSVSYVKSSDKLLLEHTQITLKVNDLRSVANDLVASYESDLLLIVCEPEHYNNLDSFSNAIYFIL